MRPLSYSQIDQYQSCPLKYRFLYIDGLKPLEKGYFSFGTTLHDCAEHFFRVKVPPPLSLEKLMEYYQSHWRSGGYESVEIEENYRQLGREILAEFHRIHRADFHMPLAVEHQYTVNLDGVKLTGKIDRVDKLPSGELCIVDYKSNKDLFSAEYVQDNLQLSLYQLAVEQIWYLPVGELCLYHLRSNTAMRCPARSKEVIADARRLVLEVAEKIEKAIFPACENNFCPCDFAHLCPLYRHKYAPPPQLPEASPIDIPLAVEEYVMLQFRKNEIEARIESLKEAIIEYCRASSLGRVFGSEHALSYKEVSRSGYNKQAVHDLLEPLGLWDKVSELDKTLLEKYLETDACGKELKDRILALKEVVSTSPRLYVKQVSKDKDS
ncbi:MAG: exonuclease [Dehalococcoides mccartyi]|uniref:RecB family exonuclease n=1 Tax=Dehalococcoides mccartyi TaxID=61435 RepID=UPI000804DA4F|nr:PD-(D/E)XK nuclease family protein [Dehalococcoides mccartyi]OBW63219.1 MAG: exonuclease [Dehalococcoides mccartyi]